MGHIFLSFLFFNFIYIVIFRHYKKGDYYINKRDLLIYTLLLVAFGTYGGGEGDYIHYKERVEEIHSILDVISVGSMEIQYYYLAYLVDGNYNLWRFVLFSIQFIGMSFFLYKAKLNTYPVFLCFISICLVESVYGRAFWGSICFFMGTYLLIEKKNPLFLIAIALSYFSHTQNMVLLALLPLAFIDFKEWHLVIVVLLMGVIVSLFKDTFTSYLDSGGIEGADYFNSRLETYSDKTGHRNFGNSFGETLVFILRYTLIVGSVLSWLRMILVHRVKYLSFYKPDRRLINITIGVTTVSFVLLISSVGSGTLFYRVLSMTLFPISILIPYMAENKKIKKKSLNRIIFLYFVVAELSYAKDLYYAYVSGNY